MFLLNLLFDINNTDGTFASTAPGAPGGPLNQSRHWLRRRGAEPPFNAGSQPSFNFNPEDGNWDDVGEFGTLFLPSNPAPGKLCIRLSEFNGNIVGLKVQLLVSFGRPLIADARTPQASPFTANGLTGGQVLTAFLGPPFPAVTSGTFSTDGRPNTSQGWFFSLGDIVRRPQGIGAIRSFLTDRYEFSIGAIVTDTVGVQHHYGDDPEADIGQ
jgi:hypothetical protein